MTGITGSDVFFTDMEVDIDDSLLKKMRRVCEAAGIGKIDVKKKLVAIKMHFGEYGNLSFLRPNYAKVVADMVRENGGIPFLTDCNTLYAGCRKNAVEHLDTAYANGFGPLTTGCQIIIGDGLKGSDETVVPINGEYVTEAKIGKAVAEADVIISLSHFKCHELTGIGGAVKNLGMGCASRRGKMEQHSEAKPLIDRDECRGCRECFKACAHGAISFPEKKAVIDYSICVGCGMCISACRFDAVSAGPDSSKDLLGMKMAEYAAAVVQGKPNFHISVVCDVSPLCDCHGGNSTPIIPDVGIFASFDPVALDAACARLSAAQEPIGRKVCGRDIFADVNEGTDWRIALEHAEKMGLGTASYNLIGVR
ncbi:MAG: DUF362 domain-containing protein [Candidatus Methanomethylophilaceae archaeon]|nr:DUF362 domain-containing protein [Candidatus Methanomethylophilaceae archaeon]